MGVFVVIFVVTTLLNRLLSLDFSLSLIYLGSSKTTKVNLSAQCHYSVFLCLVTTRSTYPGGKGVRLFVQLRVQCFRGSLLCFLEHNARVCSTRHEPSDMMIGNLTNDRNRNRQNKVRSHVAHRTTVN